MPATGVHDRAVAAVAATPATGASRPGRLLRFTAERFPPVPQVVLLATLWVCMVAAGYVAAGSAGVGSAARDIVALDVVKVVVAFAALLLFAFGLRIFDDVKDADHDRAHERERPVARGVVGERELDAFALLLFALQLALAATISTPTLMAWSCAVAFALLMRVEFFAPRWLEPRPLTYAATHMANMVFVCAMLAATGIAVAGVGSGDALRTLVSPPVLLLCAGGFATGMGFELGRKFARYHEPHGRMAVALWIACPSAGAALFVAAAVALDLSALAVLAIAGLAVSIAVVHVAAWARRRAPGDTFVETAPAVAGLALYAAMAVACVVAA